MIKMNQEYLEFVKTWKVTDAKMERNLKNALFLRVRFHASILDSSLSYVNGKRKNF